MPWQHHLLRERRRLQHGGATGICEAQDTEEPAELQPVNASHHRANLQHLRLAAEQLLLTLVHRSCQRFVEKALLTIPYVRLRHQVGLTFGHGGGLAHTVVQRNFTLTCPAGTFTDLTSFWT